MKKSVALLMTGILSAALLTGCGGGDTSSQSTEADPPSTIESTMESLMQATGLELPATIVNNYSDTAITKLYISGHGLNTWGEDLLDGRTIARGQQLPLTLNMIKDISKWDIKIADEKGNEVIFRELDLSNVSSSGCTITLGTDKEGNPVVTAE